jgi:hypothetical protein
MRLAEEISEEDFEKYESIFSNLEKPEKSLKHVF